METRPGPSTTSATSRSDPWESAGRSAASRDAVTHRSWGHKAQTRSGQKHHGSRGRRSLTHGERCGENGSSSLGRRAPARTQSAPARTATASSTAPLQRPRPGAELQSTRLTPIRRHRPRRRCPPRAPSGPSGALRRALVPTGLHEARMAISSAAGQSGASRRRTLHATRRGPPSSTSPGT